MPKILPLSRRDRRKHVYAAGEPVFVGLNRPNNGLLEAPPAQVGASTFPAPPPQVPPRSISDTSTQRVNVSIPIPHQHEIFTWLQQQQEEGCFAFATRWLPNLLNTRNWTCPVSVELNIWARILPIYFNSIHPSATTASDAITFSRRLRACSCIRHAAVHRHTAKPSEIADMMRDAVAVLVMLKETKAADRVERVLESFLGGVEDFELTRKRRQTELDAEVDAIRARFRKEEAEACESAREKAEMAMIDFMKKVEVVMSRSSSSDSLPAKAQGSTLKGLM